MRRIAVFSTIALVAICFTECKNDDPGPVNYISLPEFNQNLTYGTMTDQDGNEYKTITIGSQTWMAENLRTTKYRDGSRILGIADASTWGDIGDIREGAYCNYNNTRWADSITANGRLYNWFAVSDSRSLAPEGWHIPTDAEWSQLYDYLGGEEVAGSKLKEVGINHWQSPNVDATNESGFTALPAGSRFLDGSSYVFGDLSTGGLWWSSNANSDTEALCRHTSCCTAFAHRYPLNKVVGLSIRCIKD
jgi:uncharacterized protein (TIGR02145 family)